MDTNPQRLNAAGLTRDEAIAAARADAFAAWLTLAEMDPPAMHEPRDVADCRADQHARIARAQ